jgi:uncharacterized NAD-dependent epimerase/dehydratase family protein
MIGNPVPVRALPRPYLVFVGDEQHRSVAKTGAGVFYWAPETCAGQWRLSAEAIDLGLVDMAPAEAASAGAKSLLIGVAPVGGLLPQHWVCSLAEALRAGLDIVSGLHTRLNTIPELATLAASLGRKIHDVRHSDTCFPVATGRKRRGKRVLTVGTDCAIGKKYAALALTAGLKARGIAADFRATGQTGIMISGSGVAIDAVVADFVAGAAECLSRDAADNHWDVIEGQGSLFHPAYAGVTVGLIHGSQPDALILCHQPGLETIKSFPDYPIVPVETAIGRYLDIARLTNAGVRFVGVSLDTSGIDEDRARELCADMTQRTGLPATDPLRFGMDAIMDRMLQCA